MSTRKRRSDGEQSRANILATALRLFRERGFEETTMRDIASASGLSLGAAYHYFPSKEALIFAYYEHLQEKHAEAARVALAGLTDLSSRMRAVVLAKLDLLQDDRRIMRAILQIMFGANPVLSVFSPETRGIREQSMAILEEALVCPEVPEEARPLFTRALWALLLGFLLYFVDDTSEGQQKTRALANHSLEMIANMAPMLGSPMLLPIRDQITHVLLEAGLLSETQPL